MLLSEYGNETDFQPEHLWTSFDAQASQSAHLPAVIKLQTNDKDLTLSYAQLKDTRVGAVDAPISSTMLAAPDELKHMFNISAPKVVVVESYEAAAAVNGLIFDGDLILNKLSSGSKDARSSSNSRNGLGILKPRAGRYQGCRAWPALQCQPKDGQGHDIRPVDLSADDSALLIFTSGSTSLPKGCLYTRRSYSAGCHGFATMRRLQQ